MTASGVHRRRLDPVPESIAEARRFVSSLADDAGWPSDRIEDLRLVVSEAVTNAVRAQRRTGEAGAVELTCRADPDEIVLTVTDHGGGFVPPVGADRREPSATLEREGGYGLSLILMLADETRYERTDGGTTVRLRWTRELRG